jgi:hypothetical protein
VRLARLNLEAFARLPATHLRDRLGLFGPRPQVTATAALFGVIYCQRDSYPLGVLVVVYIILLHGSLWIFSFENIICILPMPGGSHKIELGSIF